jgi:type IV pilus assembly protein PilZ
VLSLNIRERAALYAAYMPFLKGGGIFIPTSRQYQLGEEVFMLLSLMDDPNRIAVQGKVVWITPEGVQGNRTQGIGVQFTQDDTGATARATIEQILGENARFDPPDAHDVATRRSASRAGGSGAVATVALRSRPRSSPLRCSSTRTVTSIFPSLPPSCLRCSTPWRRHASRTRFASR